MASSAAPLVKICGLTRSEDAMHAAAAGAIYGGVILAPGGRRSISAAAAASVFAGTTLRRVGVFVDAPADALARDADAAALDVVQLHGDESPSFAAAIRAERRWTVWKAVRPRGADDFLAAIERYAGSVDGLLLDGWSDEARGGTGAAFPWEIVAAHRGRIPPQIELIVAGGLTPSNVSRAVSLLAPAVVDVSSGVEVAPGVKEPGAVAAFIEAARGA